MISIIVPAYREEKNIGKCFEAILDQVSDLHDQVELILVCPDEETKLAAQKVVDKRNFKEFRYFSDEAGTYGKGKMNALNLAFKKAGGDIFVCTDGDVAIGKNALSKLVSHFENPKVGGVTGRPVCANPRNNLWGYWGHMLMDAADQTRRRTLGKGKFFDMSGYLLAVRNLDIEIPPEILDDVYLSYKVINEGYRIEYEPEAEVFVWQPSTLKDWVKQKVRSVGGHYNIAKSVGKQKPPRSFLGEVLKAWYPIGYARNLKELFWSLLQFPLRLYIWVAAFFKVKLSGKKAGDIWGRVDSTKTS